MFETSWMLAFLVVFCTEASQIFLGNGSGMVQMDRVVWDKWLLQIIRSAHCTQGTAQPFQSSWGLTASLSLEHPTKVMRLGTFIRRRKLNFSIQGNQAKSWSIIFVGSHNEAIEQIALREYRKFIKRQLAGTEKEGRNRTSFPSGVVYIKH